jgi:hypothetical protein
MLSKILTTAALLSAFSAANAFRVLETIENGVEVSLAGVTLPTSADGTVTFRKCAGCPISTHRLGDNTTFLVDNRAVALADFLGVAATIRENRSASEATQVTVFLHTTTARVTRIALNRGEQ